ncbi:MAG: hypothetical protein ACJASM_002321 [Salibacteraceae bacterium]|jgi:hypothetical protein
MEENLVWRSQYHHPRVQYKCSLKKVNKKMNSPLIIKFI